MERGSGDALPRQDEAAPSSIRPALAIITCYLFQIRPALAIAIYNLLPISKATLGTFPTDGASWMMIAFSLFYFYIALFSALEQTHYARMRFSVQE